MPVISIIFLGYVFAGPYLPGLLAHKGASIGRAASHFWLTSEGVFGVALATNYDPGKAAIEANRNAGGEHGAPNRNAGGEHA